MEKQKCPELRFSQYKNDWYETTLGDVVDIVGGGTPDTNVSEFWNGDIDWYSPTEIGENVYANGSTKKITALGLKNSSAKILPAKKTVLFSSRAGIGDMAILDKPAATNQGFQSFVANNIDVYFLYSMGVKIKKFALSKASGSTFLEISRNQLAQMEFLAPSIDSNEQTQIGNFFKNLDQSIALQEKKLTQTQNLKKAMLEKMFPKAGSKQPEIRLKEFSGDWELQPLENIFGKIRNAFVGTATPYYVKNGRFYLESNNVKNGQINRKSEIFINDYFYFKQQDKWLKTNDIVMVQSGHVGHAAVISEELNNSAAHALIMFTDYKVDADPHFINYQIQTDNAKNEIDKITTGNTIKHILSSDMKKFSLLFPCVKEQKEIGQFFKQLDETLALQQQQLQTLKNLKQAFLNKMFV